MKSFDFEPATAKRINELVGDNLSITSQSFIVTHDGDDIGVVGLYRREAHLVLFSYIKPEVQKELKRYRRVVIMAYRRMMEIIQSQPLPVFSEADDVEGADRLLEHIGFEPVKGRLYKWHG